MCKPGPPARHLKGEKSAVQSRRSAGTFAEVVVLCMIVKKKLNLRIKKKKNPEIYFLAFYTPTSNRSFIMQMFCVVHMWKPFDLVNLCKNAAD